MTHYGFAKDYDNCNSTMIVLSSWTLTMSTMALSSTVKYWTVTPGFADV